MADASFYLLIKSVHHVSIALSLSLFTARWIGVLSAGRWPMAKPVRYISVGIDTLLLGAGITLWSMGNWHPWQHPWLGFKLVCLVGYVVLGSWALKRAASRLAQAVFGVLAVTVAIHMLGMAIHHRPSGWFTPHWVSH